MKILVVVCALGAVWRHTPHSTQCILSLRLRENVSQLMSPRPLLPVSERRTTEYCRQLDLL
jgi:hypothetical protein